MKKIVFLLFMFPTILLCQFSNRYEIPKNQNIILLDLEMKTSGIDYPAVFSDTTTNLKDYIMFSSSKWNNGSEHLIGPIHIKFEVKANGYISNVSLAGDKLSLNQNGGHRNLAMNMIREMKSWKPALKDGKATESSYIIKIGPDPMQQLKFEFSKIRDLVEGYSISSIEDDLELNTLFPKFSNVTLSPTFPGGQEELEKFLFKHIIHPIKKDEERPEGGLMAFELVFDKFGKIESMRITRMISCPNKCNDFAAKVIKEEMPDWIPAVRNGNAVRAGYELFIDVKYIYTKEYEKLMLE